MHFILEKASLNDASFFPGLCCFLCDAFTRIKQGFFHSPSFIHSSGKFFLVDVVECTSLAMEGNVCL